MVMLPRRKSDQSELNFKKCLSFKYMLPRDNKIKNERALHHRGGHKMAPHTTGKLSDMLRNTA